MRWVWGVIFAGCLAASMVGAAQTFGLTDDGESPVTPKATAPTPRPAPTVTEDDSTAQIAYADAVIEQTTIVAASLDRFSDLSTRADLMSADWQVDVLVELAIWQATYRAAVDLSPPQSLLPIHLDYVVMMRLVNDAATDVAVAIDTVDAARMRAAGDKLRRSAEMADDITDRIRAMI